MRRLGKRAITPPWPPLWNPFEVFLLALSVISSGPLLKGHSGSALLDQRLPDWEVIIWGVMLAVGSLIALTGVICYRHQGTLMIGLYCERTGLILVGGGFCIYTYVILASAADLNGVRWAATVQFAYALACFFRVWQDTIAIRRAHALSALVDTMDGLDGGGGDEG